MPKFKAPENFGGFTSDGKSYKADKKGFVTLPDGFDANIAASHGLMSADGTPAAAEDADTDTDAAGKAQDDSGTAGA
jgi:hypothetical protein